MDPRINASNNPFNNNEKISDTRSTARVSHSHPIPRSIQNVISNSGSQIAFHASSNNRLATSRLPTILPSSSSFIQPYSPSQTALRYPNTPQLAALTPFTPQYSRLSPQPSQLTNLTPEAPQFNLSLDTSQFAALTPFIPKYSSPTPQAPQFTNPTPLTPEIITIAPLTPKPLESRSSSHLPPFSTLDSSKYIPILPSPIQNPPSPFQALLTIKQKTPSPPPSVGSTITRVVSPNHRYDWQKEEDLTLLASIRISQKRTQAEKYEEAAKKLERNHSAVKKRFSLLGGKSTLSEEDARFVELADKCKHKWSELFPESFSSQLEAQEKYQKLLESIPSIKKRKRDALHAQEKDQTVEDTQTKEIPRERRKRRKEGVVRTTTKKITAKGHSHWGIRDDLRLITYNQTSQQKTAKNKFQELAEKMGRTPESIRNRLRSFQLSPETNLSQDEIELVEIAIRENYNWPKIAALCSLTAKEVENQYHELAEKVQALRTKGSL